MSLPSPQEAVPPVAAPAIAASRPLSWRERLLYGAGGMLDQWGQHGLKNHANAIFNIVLGINPAVVGAVMALSRVWDAVTDPIMGSWSDNARTRWGRRRPFIAAGALTCGLASMLLWWVPSGLDAGPQFAWLLGTALLFYTTYTVFSVPYHALAYEVAQGYDEKTRLLGVRMVFATSTNFLGAWIFALTQNGWLGTPQESARLIGFLLGFILIGSGLLAAAVRERPSVTVARQAPVPLLLALRRTLACRPFVRLLGAALLTVIGLNLINPLGTYVNIYYVFGGDAKAASVVGGWVGMQWGVTVLVATPLLVRLSRRIGKRNALSVAFALALVGTVSKWWLYTPSAPYAQLLVTFLLAPGMAGLWMLSEAMVADVSEFETWRSGERIEGMFGAVYGWILKSGLALGVFLSGFLLVWTGFDVAHGPVQSPETLWWLRFLFAFLPSLAIIVAIIVLRGFPLDRAMMEKIREELDRRERAAETSS